MPVNLAPPRPEDLLPVRGVALGVTEAGVRKAERRDLLVVRLAEGASVAGVFTQNRFCAAPVLVCKEHLALEAPVRALRTGSTTSGVGWCARKSATVRITSADSRAPVFAASTPMSS